MLSMYKYEALLLPTFTLYALQKVILEKFFEIILKKLLSVFFEPL